MAMPTYEETDIIVSRELATPAIPCVCHRQAKVISMRSTRNFQELVQPTSRALQLSRFVHTRTNAY